MIRYIYKKALTVLMKKPFRLWGISLLAGLLTFIGSCLFGVIPGVALAISVLISTSMTMVFLHGFRGEEVRAHQLFDCCKDWNTVKRTLGGMGWRELFIFLWGLIPIAGPILSLIRTYEYRLTPYILVQEPDVPITEAIKVSKERTNGYKLKMFFADLLIDVIVIGAILVVLLLGILTIRIYIGYLFLFIVFILTIVYAALRSLFLGLVQAAFYEEITNKEYSEYNNRYNGAPYGAPYNGAPYGAPYGDPNAYNGAPYGAPYGVPNGYNPGAAPYPAPNGYNPGAAPYPDPNAYNPGAAPYPDPNAYNSGAAPYPDPNAYNPGAAPYPDPNAYNPGAAPYPDPNAYNPGAAPYPDPNANGDTNA